MSSRLLLVLVVMLAVATQSVKAAYNCKCPETATNPDGTTSSHGTHDEHEPCNDPAKFLAPVAGVCQPDECWTNSITWYRANNGGSGPEGLPPGSPRLAALNTAAEQNCKALIAQGKCEGWMGGNGWFCRKPASSSPTPAPTTTTKTCTCSNGQKVDTCTDSTKPCKSCNANFKLISGKCQACEAGTHQTSGTFTGSSCTANACTCINGNNATGAACTSDKAAICASCKVGYRKDGDSCTQCTAGTHQGNSAHTGSTCSPCAQGTFSAAGATVCTAHRVCDNKYGNDDNSGFTKQAGTDKANAVCSVACTDVKAKHTNECAANKCGLSSKKTLCKQLKAIYKANPACTCPSPTAS